MALSDAYVRVMCDGDDCYEEEECRLPFTYATLSGSGGRYDHDNPDLPQGWVKVGDAHYCEECAEARRQIIPEPDRDAQ